MIFFSISTILIVVSLGSSQNTGSAEDDWKFENAYPRFSAQAPSASRETSRQSQPPKPTFDYSKGFPSDFSQGLPTFDFSRPMGATAQKDDHKSAETENLGFVHGPPDGFPNLDQLGGGFPAFGESGQSGGERGSGKDSYPHRANSHVQSQRYPGPPQSHGGSRPGGPPGPSGPGPFPHGPGSSEEDYYGPPGPSRPGPQSPPSRPHASASSHPTYDEHSSAESMEQSRGPPSYPGGPDPAKHHGRGPPPPPAYPHRGLYQPYQDRPSPPPYPQQYKHREPLGSPSNYGGGKPPHNYQPKKPIVLKISNKKTRPEKLPPGPPVFYAPSPDMESSSHHQDNSGAGSYESYRPPKSFDPYHLHSMRFKRSTPKEVKPSTSEQKDTMESYLEKEDLNPAASETDTYWELTSSPFLVFDTYKNEQDHEHDEPHTHGASGNVTFLDTDGGEQRFFPSFPAPAPYLVGPFGNNPPSRPPLFPGPAANRAPSRYHPSFSPKYSPPGPPPPPSRGSGPSIYSAESHDHYQDNNLLGSGNFEVVRGGTYYGDDDDGYGGGGGHGGAYHADHDDDYYPGNGHSAPEGYRVPAHGHGGGDFFANFRDFADINPPSRSFSHRHEALAIPNDSMGFSRQPKNILDKLESSSSDAGSSYSPVPHSTISRESDPMMATF